MAIIKRETDYALRVLVRMATEPRFVPVSVLAEQEDVPELFLRKIMQRLQRAEIVESRQGPFGGYRLAHPAEQVFLLDVVETVQGPLVMNECFGDAGVCSRMEVCPMRTRLAELQVRLNAELAEVSIAEVAEELPLREEVAK
ncbi:MAG: RrF2 family transcriptional regulator [Planctomycetota bacterium]|jgi:Rrf2 family protein